ncbi:hypothetical protein AJ80_05748 [Polytolypa hystricis UAMH7299]|uniref:Pre-mRNA-splicing factor SLT11 n=1 Tax=Polytolypa hystricis (strain UAMH7299) TaxID=1447883 RepID=A0A2B7Y163_POLH7|nr:hypothetical protein AJ80_05748 [Polytolypa hystricis UAMH7299]
MASQIKRDVNRSEGELSDTFSVCNNCLPAETYFQMLREDYGAACNTCQRPMTVFIFKVDRTAKPLRTKKCLTCARLKNCCQVCPLDLVFGLPIAVRDAALKMVAPGPQSDINREYYAQVHEKELEEGRGAVEQYEKSDERARDLLRRLANSKPYHRRMRLEDTDRDQETSPGQSEGSEQRQIGYGPPPGSGSRPGPIRTRDMRPGGVSGAMRNGRGRGRGGRPFPRSIQPPRPEDILPPAERNIATLLLSGVDDDLPEYEIRAVFSKFGTIQSIICSHRSHCAFVNYATRKAAEKAAEHCQGRIVIRGCPLRVQWSKPKPLDNMDREERMQHARAGRQTAAAIKAATGGRKAIQAPPEGHAQEATPKEEEKVNYALAPPPGSGDVKYASMSGD